VARIRVSCAYRAPNRLSVTPETTFLAVAALGMGGWSTLTQQSLP